MARPEQRSVKPDEELQLIMFSGITSKFCLLNEEGAWTSVTAVFLEIGILAAFYCPIPLVSELLSVCKDEEEYARSGELIYKYSTTITSQRCSDIFPQHIVSKYLYSLSHSTSEFTSYLVLSLSRFTISKCTSSNPWLFLQLRFSP